MAAGKYSLNIEQGSTVDFEVQYKDSNGNPVDLTGCWGAMQIRSNYADNNPTTYVTLTTTLNPDNTGLSFSGSVSSPPKPPTSGSIGIYISSCTSSLFQFNEAYYDLEIYSGNPACPVTVRLLEGRVQLSKEVTRI